MKIPFSVSSVHITTSHEYEETRNYLTNEVESMTAIGETFTGKIILQEGQAISRNFACRDDCVDWIAETLSNQTGDTP